jgi:hypothetical protein
MLEIFLALLSALWSMLTVGSIVILIVVLVVIIYFSIPAIIEDPKAFIKTSIHIIWLASVIYYLVVYGSSMLTSALSFMGFLVVLFGGAWIASWLDDLLS